MIDRSKLLSDLARLTGRLHSDMRERAEKDPATEAHLRAEYQRAQAAGRTAMAYEAWREDPLTQGAVAWVLSCVFVRFLEDNGLLDAKGGLPRRYLWGSQTSLRALAEGNWEEHLRLNPSHAEREYLLSVFAELGRLPGAKHLFDPRHNLAFTLAPTADGAKELLKFWRSIEPETGKTVHDFRSVGVGGPSSASHEAPSPASAGEGRLSPPRSSASSFPPSHGYPLPHVAGEGGAERRVRASTRFLGDLYQDLSEHARSTYALLQTPSFVEEFILDRTLTPAIEEFGYEKVTLIDAACGSGHFLLGAFSRLAVLWQENQPGLPGAAVAQKALSAVFGVDLNPFAAAIARFRLLIAALDVAGVSHLADAADFKINVAVGDSLLHGPKPGSRTEDYQPDLYGDPLGHLYESEDATELREILFRRYHAVVANPPYITVKDPGLNARYRERFKTCKGKYSLVCPFTERLIDLTLQSDPGGPAGFMGQIVSNAFMKREFGGRLVEEYLPRWDLTHVIDTSGAYIPGHGTPTVIMFARGRGPQAAVVRTVMGIRGEPRTPDDPAKGLVWSAIVEQVDKPGSKSDWVSVDDVPRERLAKHPWSLGGGGAAELKVAIEGGGRHLLGQIADSIGITSFTLEDDIYLLPLRSAQRHRIRPTQVRPMVIGDALRDWGCGDVEVAVFPYTHEYQPMAADATDERLRYLWLGRTCLANNRMFGQQTKIEAGLQWYEFGRLTADKLRTPLSITFAFVATHNHFVLDRGGKVFNRSAPVIKLPAGATEDEHLALLGLLNSSTACFWMKQVCHNKGATSDTGVLQADPEKFRFEFDGTKLSEFPVPKLSDEQTSALLAITRTLDRDGRALSEFRFDRFLDDVFKNPRPMREQLGEAMEARTRIRARMVRLQEELDWLCYELFGLLDHKAPARSRAWTTEPAEMPELAPDERPYRLDPESASLPPGSIEAARFHLIKADPNIGLIEKPDYKRRWFRSAGAYDDTNVTDELLLQRGLRQWLLDRLEKPDCWPTVELQSTTLLSDRVRRDPDFHEAARLFTNRPDVDVEKLVAELAVEEGVPYLAALRYTEDGLRKRALWERTWDLQRAEDRGEKVGDIPVPPKYAREDFLKSPYWSHRGKLDVPKEEFILYPGAERQVDPAPVLGWAGWDHLQRAKALSAYFERMKTQEGFTKERLVPLLAGIDELVPWLLQWHNEIDPEFGIGMGTYFEQYVDEEARSLGMLPADLARWRPEKGAGRRRARSRG